MRRYVVFLFCMLSMVLSGQETFKIGLIVEGDDQTNSEFENMVKEEIQTLLNNRKNIQFESRYVGYDPSNIQTQIEQALQSDLDVLVSLGLSTSNAFLHRDAYPKPMIAGIVLHNEIQQVDVTPAGTSGVDNFSFIVSPFDVQRDLEIFHEIYPYKNLGLLTDQNVIQWFPLLRDYFTQIQPDCVCPFIEATGDVDKDISGISDDIDAIYVLPLSGFPQETIENYLKQMTRAGLPTFALFGRPYTQSGAMGSVAASNFLPTYARRIALNVLKIAEGKNPAEFNVRIEGMQDDFVINMPTVRELGIYPDFDVLNQATLIGVDEVKSENKLNIEFTILQALQENLGYKTAQINNDLAETDIKLARAQLYPQLDANVTTAIADQNTELGNGDELIPGNYSVGANLTQLVYSEPARANVAIQRILKDQTLAATHQSKLDIVLSAAQTYLQYLTVKSLVRINNENLEVTKQNLAISRSKNKLGYSSSSDVYRLESQMAQNTIDLNSALTQLDQSRFAINQLINRDITDYFEAEDVDLSSPILMTSDGDLELVINNQRDYNEFVNFMVEESFINLPELTQIKLAIDAQERLMKSNKRSIYTPQVALSGGYSKTLGQFNLPTGLELTKSPTWSAGVSASLPIFQGGLRKQNIEQNRLTIEQLDLQRRDSRQQLELALRSNMESMSFAYTQMFLSRDAATAGLNNFNIIQDLYRQGEVNITTLIDAQNAYLQADLSATNAVYEFMLGLLTVERSTGNFYFLMNDAERNQWKNRLVAYLLKKK